MQLGEACNVMHELCTFQNNGDQLGYDTHIMRTAKGVLIIACHVNFEKPEPTVIRGTSGSALKVDFGGVMPTSKGHNCFSHGLS